MATLKEIRLEILNLSDAERINLAARSCNTLRGAFSSRSDYISLMRLLAQVFVSADRNCDRYEYDLYVKATGDDVTYQQFFDFTNYGSSSEKVNAMLQFTDSIHSDYRAAVAVFGCCLMAHDGTLTVAEQEIFNRILS